LSSSHIFVFLFICSSFGSFLLSKIWLGLKSYDFFLDSSLLLSNESLLFFSLVYFSLSCLCL
jgi:hypothetical protein